MKKTIAILTFITLLFALLTIPVTAEPLSITANKATIVIDGVKDDAFGDANLTITAVQEGTPGAATGKVWTAWDDGYMYFYIEVYDNTPNHWCATDEAHFRDSAEVYLDWNNGQGGDREASPETPYYQVRVNSAPDPDGRPQLTGFILDDMDWGGFADWTLRGQEEKVKFFAGPISGDYKNGYILEFAVPVPTDYPVKLTEGKQIPFDVQINDNMKNEGRTDMIYINSNNDGNGNQWQAPNCCGALITLGAAYVAPANNVEEPVAPVAVDVTPVIVPETKAAQAAPKTGDIGIIVPVAVMLAGVVVFKKKIAVK